MNFLNFLRHSEQQMKSKKNDEKFAYCEASFATPYSPWCIRELTDKGKKLGGGIDTDSLCGRVKAHWGWDLEVSVLTECDGQLPPARVCKKCFEKYQELLKSE